MEEENISQEINNEENVQDTEGTNAQDLVEETIPADADSASAEEDSQPVEEISSEDNTKKRKKRKRKKIQDYSLENDIKYRGPLSYRWLRVLAWASIVAAQAALVMGMGAKMDPNLAKNFGGLQQFLNLFGTMSLSFFLMANFAIILNAKNGYKRLILAYSFMALVIFALFMLIYQRYILGIIKLFASEEGVDPQETALKLVAAFSNNGYISFNIFIDLLLCTLFTMFVNYNPKRVFVGKKLIIFRLFALIPAGYEIASIILKILCVVKLDFVLPLYFAPFLTTKSPLTFVLFVILAFFIKNRERLFLKRGKTKEDYEVFLKTNVNSLHFSIAASVCMVITAVLDAILLVVIGAALAAGISEGTEDIEMAIMIGFQQAHGMGFGKSLSLLFVVPFVMLFSYTRTHKPSSTDMIIPFVGIMCLALVYAEGLYQFLLRLPTMVV